MKITKIILFALSFFILGTLFVNAKGVTSSVTVTVSPPHADLIASAPSQTAAIINKPINFTSSITNNGDITTGTSFSNFFQIAASPNGTGPITSLTSTPSPMPVLAINASAVSTSASYTRSATGIYSVRACADNNVSMVGSITETNETNNCSAWVNVTVSAAPTIELTASAPSPFTAVIGTPKTFSSSVINASSSSTGASFYNSFQIATGASGTGTITTIASTPSPMLALAGLTNATASATYTFTGVAGTRSVRLCADNNTSMVGSIAEINENNNCSGWSNITVTSTVPAVSISVNPTSGTVNVVNPALTWSVTNNPTSCTASGDWSGTKASSGTNVSQGVLTQARPYTYVLTCTNASGTSGSAATVVVSPPSPTATISANPSSLNQGQSTTLTWSSTSADYCTSNFFSGNGPTSSNLLVTPSSLPKTYTLSCINTALGEFASDEATVSVTVKKNPIFQEN